MSEFHDEYSESLDAEFRKLEDALLSDEVRLLAPSEPIRLSRTRPSRRRSPGWWTTTGPAS